MLCMGHANVYIRKDNESKWEAIMDKSAWVNEKLVGEPLWVSMKDYSENLVTEHEWKKPVNLPELEKVKEIFSPKLCSHGFAPHLCKFKKAGKPCKEK